MWSGGTFLRLGRKAVILADGPVVAAGGQLAALRRGEGRQIRFVGDEALLGQHRGAAGAVHHGEAGVIVGVRVAALPDDPLVVLVVIGVAAKKSLQEGRPVKLSEIC